MNRLRMSRPSPAMAVALLALFVSLGGVSYGVATGFIDSREIKNNTIRTKDIRNNDVRGLDIRNSTVRGRDILSNTVRGVDVFEPSLGLVPRSNLATRANSAAAVDRLKTAAPYQRVGASASGGSAATARAAAAKVPLFSAGPFDVYGKCYTDTSGPTTHAETFISTRQSGAVFNSASDELSGDPFLDAGIAETAAGITDASAGANSADVSGVGSAASFSAAAPDGTAITGIAAAAAKNGTPAGGDGIYGAGEACLFWGNEIG